MLVPSPIGEFWIANKPHLNCNENLLTRLIYTFDTFALSIVNDFPINSCHRAHKKVSSFGANKISVCNFLHPCFETLSSSHTDLLRGPDSINTRDNHTIHWPFAEALNLTKESIFFGINFPVPCTTHYRSSWINCKSHPIFWRASIFNSSYNILPCADG